MDKRYQVFVSSTYTDLVEERRHVTQALLEMDCIPAGMEMFPAIDEDQFEFIKTVIDDCDYYLLIIAGRYGSLDPQGISYTEKEYDYAVAKGIPVIALLHANPTSIEAGKTEQTPEGREKLAKFREKAQGGRLSKDWRTPDDLAGLVSRALHISFKRFPATGWIRADKAASEDLLNDVNVLRKENEELRSKLAESRSAPITPENIASFEEEFKIRGHGFVNERFGNTGRTKSVSKNWTRVLTWKQIFGLVSPHLLSYPNDAKAKNLFTEAFDDGRVSLLSLDDHVYQTIKIQLEAYNLIKADYMKSTDGGMALFISLTSYGKAMLKDVRIVKAKLTEEET